MNKNEFCCTIVLSEKEIERRFIEAVRTDKKRSRVNGKPTCEYDREKGKAYLLFPDGRRVYYTDLMKLNQHNRRMFKRIVKSDYTRGANEAADPEVERYG